MADSMDKKYSNVPNLRFSKFSENYSSCRFVDALTFLNSNSFSRDEMNFEEGNYKNIHYGDILIKFPTLVDYKSTLIPFVNKNVVVTPKMNLLKDGDIVIADTAEDYTAGKAIELVVGKDKILSGLHTIPCRPRFKFSSGYLGYYLNSSSFRKNLLPLIQGIKVYSVSKYMFNSLYIKYPSLEEQQKVSNLLFKIDHRISTQNKIIREYETIIKQISDEFFNSLKTYTFFKQIYNKASEGGTPDTKNISYYQNGTIPFIKIDDLNKKYLIQNKAFITESGLAKSSAWLIPTGAILLSNGATIGETTITTYPVATKQGILGIVPNEKFYVEFLYYLFKSKIFRKSLKKITTKGTMDAAYLKDIDKIKIPVCNLAQQKEFAKSISFFEEKLECEKQLLKRLNSLKFYLLNNLFI